MKRYIIKISSLLALTIFFTFIYSFLDNSHFAGLNPIEDKLKENEIEEKTDEIIQETSSPMVESFFVFNHDDKNKDEPEEEIRDNIEKVAEEDKEKLKDDSFQQKFFDRLYFSIITACLVGYGDIYPSTNTLKTIVSFQTLTTLCLILA